MPPPGSIWSGPQARWWSFLLAGGVYSLFMLLAFPPIGLWPLTLLAAVPLVWAGCRGERRPVLAAVLSGAATLPLWLYEEQWLIEITTAAYPLMALGLAVFPGLFVWLIANVRASGLRVPMAVAAPVLWGMLEAFRGEIAFTGFAWFLIAHPVIDLAPAAAPASLLGTYFVSFLIVTFAGATADAAGWSRTPRSGGGLAGLVALAIWGLASRLGAPPVYPDAPVLRVAVVQTNKPQSNKLWGTIEQKVADFSRSLELTRLAAAGAGNSARPGLIIWPETMFEGRTLSPSAVEVFRRVFAQNEPELAASGERSLEEVFHQALLRTQSDAGVPMLVGSIAWEDTRITRTESRAEFEPARKFNSLFLISDGAVQAERYDKIDLTPFGEVIPYAWRWPAVENWLIKLAAGHGMTFDLSPGAEARTIALPADEVDAPWPVRVAAPICFEITRSSLCRRLAYRDGTRAVSLLVNASNDGWFGEYDFGRRQHLLASRWRSVELGVPLVRAVNTGVSAFVDVRGQIAPLRLAGGDGADPDDLTQVDGVLAGEVSLVPPEGGTLFGRIGNAFAWAVMGAGVGLTAAATVRRRRRSRSGA